LISRLQTTIYFSKKETFGMHSLAKRSGCMVALAVLAGAAEPREAAVFKGGG